MSALGDIGWILLRLLKHFYILVMHVLSYALSFFVLQDGFGVSQYAIVCLILISILLEGWLIVSFARYRLGRQMEVLQIIRSAVMSKVPLEPAFRAFLIERNEHGMFWVIQALLALIVTPVIPGAIFLWIAFYIGRFDRRARHFTDALYDGLPLDEALELYPSVLSSEARLAIRVGVVTGKLEIALDHADREPMAAAWLELLPRVIYPAVLLFVILNVIVFLIVTIVPKFKKIHDEFGIAMPPQTKLYLGWGFGIADYSSLILFLMLSAAITASVAISSSWLRWHLPLFGRYYRRDVQGRVLRMLSLLIETQVAAPETLELLAESEELPDIARKRLRTAKNAVANGTALPTALLSAGLLPGSLKSLLELSQSTGTLALSLSELGDQLSMTAYYSSRRISIVLMPLLILLIAVPVAITALAIFGMLTNILEALAG